MVDEQTVEKSDGKSAALVNFFRKLVRRVFDRVLTGDYDYEKDMRELDRYRSQARKYELRQLEPEVVNVMAVLNSISGRIEEGYLLFQQLYELAEDLDDLNGMVLSLLNQGINLQDQTKYADALDRFNAGLELLKANESEGRAVISRYGELLVSKMKILILLGELEAATALFEDIQVIAQDFVAANRQAYARVMSEAYTVMIEICRDKQDFDKAKSYMAMALELAVGSDSRPERIQIHLGGVRLALAQSDTALATSYLERVKNGLDGFEESPFKGRFVMTEARMMLSLGFGELAPDIARKALDIFEKYEMPEDVALAKTFLGEVANPTT